MGVVSFPCVTRGERESALLVSLGRERLYSAVLPRLRNRSVSRLAVAEEDSGRPTSFMLLDLQWSMFSLIPPSGVARVYVCL
jgi:hypothetical protein